MFLAMLALVGGNLLVNPSFSEGWKGWAPVWSREAGAAKAEIADGRDIGKALHVTSTGKEDWSVSQADPLPTEPRTLYQISASMKAKDLGSAEVGVITRNAKGEALAWSFGAVQTSGTHDWKRFSRRLMIPANCATIQFRVIGYGPGELWMQDPQLLRVGTITQKTGIRPVVLTTPKLQLTIDSDASLTFTDRRTKGEWRYQAPPAQLVVRDLVKLPQGSARLALWDAENDLDLQASIRLDGSEAKVTLESIGHLAATIPFPGPLKTEKGQWLIVPMNEGILYPVDDATIPPVWLVAYGGHGICMPWYGTVNPTTGAGAMTILESPDDAWIQIDRFDKGLLSVQNRFEPSRGVFAYPRSMRIAFLTHGGYTAQCKRYREYAKAKGLVVTLKEKQKRNPNVDRLIGVMNVWNWDIDKVSLCQDLKSLGLDRVLWSGTGSPEEIQKVNAMGYLGGRYDIFQDVWDPKAKLDWMPSAGWPEDLVLLANGDWMKGWSHPDKQPDGTTKWIEGGVICSKQGLARAKKTIPEDLKKTPFLARFIDTTTASPFRECYNPAHPLTRTQDREYKMDLLKFCSQDMNLVTGTETGIDPSVPFVHYYEGMMSLGPYRLPDSGTDMMAYRKPTPDFLKFQIGYGYRLPLWELVYHDCVVSQWYWGDASNKAPEVWDQRDLWNLLYGTAPLVMFDKEKWPVQKSRILKTYKDVCENIRKIGYDRMLSHEFLTPDRSVQRTKWSSGKEVVVNFGLKAFAYKGKTIKKLGFSAN